MGVELLGWIYEHVGDDYNKSLFAHVLNSVTCITKCRSVVKWLHDHSYEFCTPYFLSERVKKGDVDEVSWLAKDYPGVWVEALERYHMGDSATDAGKLVMTKWLHEQNVSLTTEAMDDAAANGYADVVAWLHEFQSEGCTTKAMDCVAVRVNFDVLKLLHNERTEGCTTSMGISMR